MTPRHPIASRVRPATGVLSSLRGSRDGTAAVEFALIAIPLFLFLFGVLEMGRVLWLQNALHYSVEEASRCAAVDAANCGTSNQVTSYAASRSGANLPSSVFTYDGAAGCGKQVTATYPVNLVIPFVNLSVTLTSSSCYPS
jgi:Flp pilus assembly protein TadG